MFKNILIKKAGFWLYQKPAFLIFTLIYNLLIFALVFEPKYPAAGVMLFAL